MQIGRTRSHDGTELATYRWTPEGPPVGHVVLVHGVGEHLGRYDHVAARLVAAGYAVRGVDFRGHGRSAGKRGFVSEWERYVEDLRTAIALDPGDAAIVAHSMGTVVSLDHLRDASAWAFVGSAVTVGVGVEAPRWKLAAARILSRALPRLSMSNEIPLDDICSDPAVREAYAADPLVFSTITPRWFTEFLGALERINAAAPAYDVPAFIPYGTEDRILSIDALRAWVARYGGEVETMPCEGMRHEVFNDRTKDEVLDRVVAFLDAHRPTPAA